MPIEHSIHSVTKIIAVAALIVSPKLVNADTFTQTNLVSDVPGLAANTDLNLKNPWGVSFSATSPFWVSNQASGTATLYDGAGNINPLVVTIPAGSTPPSGPTGQVFNTSNDFVLPNGTKATFVFDTLNGTIAGWNGAAGTTAIQMASTAGALYTGLAIGTSGGANYLYAADASGQIRVFDGSFTQVTSTVFAGKFADPNPISGFVPFNIQAVGSQLYVTYAQLTPQGTGLPGGYVDVFNTDGTFVKRVATGGALYAPWGVTLAPAGFGSFANDLLVGNFGNGEILAFDPTNGTYLGTLNGVNGQPLVNDYLWALNFRTGGANINPEALYFTAGINNQQDGLFGAITVSTPEPATTLSLAFGLLSVALLVRRRRSA